MRGSAPVSQPDGMERRLQTWMRAGDGQPALEMPLKHLAVTVTYRIDRDPRVLLTLPTEERALLTALLDDSAPVSNAQRLAGEPA